MDKILISVFCDQVAQVNKGDGDWKPQACQAVVDELKSTLSMSLTTDHVRNHVKIWKKHYGVITEIRSKTKFKWDDEREHYEEGDTMMEEEATEGRSSSLETTSTYRKKQKRDHLAEPVSCFAESFHSYVEYKVKDSGILTGKEARDVVSKVYGIVRHQILRAMKILMRSPIDFQMLKDLPEYDKLDWILLILYEGCK